MTEWHSMDREPLSNASAELWRQADRLLDTLLDLPADARSAALERIAPPPAVRERVEQLLRSVEHSGEQFEGAALRFAPAAPDLAAAFRPGTRMGR